MNARAKLRIGALGMLTAMMAACTTYEEAEVEGFYSTGDRVGYVTKFSQKGLRKQCKTWEGELAMDNFVVDSDGGTSNTFPFTVRDTSLIQDIQDAMRSGNRVNLHYNQVAFPNLCQTESGYFVAGVEVVGPPRTAPHLVR